MAFIAIPVYAENTDFLAAHSVWLPSTGHLQEIELTLSIINGHHDLGQWLGQSAWISPNATSRISRDQERTVRSLVARILDDGIRLLCSDQRDWEERWREFLELPPLGVGWPECTQNNDYPDFPKLAFVYPRPIVLENLECVVLGVGRPYVECIVQLPNYQYNPELAIVRYSFEFSPEDIPAGTRDYDILKVSGEISHIIEPGRPAFTSVSSIEVYQESPVRFQDRGQFGHTFRTGVTVQALEAGRSAALISQ